MNKKIVIIGGGLAGMLLCRRLAGNNQVTLLELGSKETISYPNLSCSAKQLAVVPTFCFGKGGTTNLWHNGLIPLDLADLQDELFRNAVADSSQYIDNVASNLFFPKSSYVEEYNKIITEINALSPAISSFVHGVDCLLYPKKYLPLSPPDTVSAFYDVNGLSFLFDDSKLLAVSFQSLGAQHQIDCDCLIVSSGAFGSPGVIQQVLDDSNYQNDQLGAGFIDHPMGFVGKIKFKPNFAPIFKKISAWNRGDYVGRAAIRLKSKCGRYSACAFFRPALTMDNDLAIYKYKSLLGASSGIKRLKSLFSWKIFHPDILSEIFAHVFGCSLPSRTYNILFISEQKRGANRVAVQGNTINVEWTITEEEVEAYNCMLSSLSDMVRNLADQININTKITEDWLWSAAHHSGTVSMGHALSDLIDENLKMNLFDNIFICDGSVLQEHSYANTGLAIGQLAFRLAERIDNA